MSDNYDNKSLTKKETGYKPSDLSMEMKKVFSLFQTSRIYRWGN